MKKVWALVLAVMTVCLMAGCSGGGLPRELPESGLIVDVTQFAGISQRRLERMVGEPSRESRNAMRNPKTGRLEGRRDLSRVYEAGDLAYSISSDVVEDIVVGMAVFSDAEVIPFDGESFKELLERFGIKMSEEAEITRQYGSRWIITNASDKVYYIIIIGYYEVDGGFTSFQVVYDEEYCSYFSE